MHSICCFIIVFTSWVTANTPVISQTSICIFVTLLLIAHHSDKTNSAKIKNLLVFFSIFPSRYAPEARALKMPSIYWMWLFHESKMGSVYYRVGSRKLLKHLFPTVVPIAGFLYSTFHVSGLTLFIASFHK